MFRVTLIDYGFFSPPFVYPFLTYSMLPPILCSVLLVYELFFSSLAGSPFPPSIFLLFACRVTLYVVISYVIILRYYYDISCLLIS